MRKIKVGDRVAWKQKPDGCIDKGRVTSVDDFWVCAIWDSDGEEACVGIENCKRLAPKNKEAIAKAVEIISLTLCGYGMQNFGTKKVAERIVSGLLAQGLKISKRGHR